MTVDKQTETETFRSLKIRFIRRDDPDLISYIAIDQQKELYEFMSPVRPSKLSLYFEALNSGEDLKEDPWNIFAVTDLKDRMVAWIQFTKDSFKNIRKIKSEYPINKNALVLESASAKIFNKNIPNVTFNNEPLYDDQDFKPDMVKARLEAEKKLVDMEQRISQEKGLLTRSIYITAYTYSENIPAETNLKNAGYTLLKTKIAYEKGDSKLSNVWIKKLN